MLVTSKLQHLYIGYLQSLPINRGLFFMENNEALSMMRMRVDFNSEDLIRVVSA